MIIYYQLYSLRMLFIRYNEIVHRLVLEAARSHHFLRPDDGEHGAPRQSAANERDEERDPDLRRAWPRNETTKKTSFALIWGI
jgi:hypothetical protein